MLRCLRVPGCEQSGEPPELAQRVIGDLIIVHRRASPERRAVGDVAEHMAGEGVSFVDLELIYVNAGSGNGEMGRDGSGEDHRWLGLTEPGKHSGGALERDTEAQPVAVAALLHCRFMQRGQCSGQVAVADADGGSQR